MITPEEFKAKLAGYPVELFAHYEDFCARNDPASLHHFVVRLIKFLNDADETASTALPPDEANLRTDLDIDSITIAEVVFLIEDVFQVEIDNEEIAAIETVGELKVFISEKVVA